MYFLVLSNSSSGYCKRPSTNHHRRFCRLYASYVVYGDKNHSGISNIEKTQCSKIKILIGDLNIKNILKFSVVFKIVYSRLQKRLKLMCKSFFILVCV